MCLRLSLRRAVDQRHDVLKLVAEPVGAAGLIVGQCAPRRGKPRPGTAASGSSSSSSRRPASRPAPHLGCRPIGEIWRRNFRAHGRRLACSRTSRRTWSMPAACPRTKMTSLLSPGAKEMSTISAAQGSCRGPNLSARPVRCKAAGRNTEPYSPRNSARSEVAELAAWLAATNASFPAKSPAHTFRATMAPDSTSRSQTTCIAASSRCVPRTHSAKYVADRSAGPEPLLVSSRCTILISSLGGTWTVNF